MAHYFYDFSKGVDIYNSLIELYRRNNYTFFLISDVGDLSRVTF